MVGLLSLPQFSCPQTLKWRSRVNNRLTRSYIYLDHLSYSALAKDLWAAWQRAGFSSRNNQMSEQVHLITE